MDFKTYKDRFGFTLAEVLITLTIIGIVAALTIPSIMQSTQNQEYVTALKKFYTQTNQALAQVALDECSPGDIKCFSDGTVMMAAIANQFKKSKDCGYSATDNCWAIHTYNYDGTNGTESLNSNGGYKFVTADGMSVYFWIGTLDCSNHLSTDPTASTYNRCGDLIVDVNGQKGPNRYGRDVFSFRITSNKAPMLYPYGGKDDDQYWKSNGTCQTSNTWGNRCGGRIMEEGWAMNY